MTLIVLLLAVWVGGCLLIAGLLWALAGARLFAHAGCDLVRWLCDPRTRRPVRVSVALLVAVPVLYTSIAVISLLADMVAPLTAAR